MVAALLPTALLAWYLSDPARNQPIDIRLEHFVITSNVSVVAALAAFLVARAALGVGHYRALLVALGFACMAAIFAVHGLSTPGVLQQGDREALGLEVNEVAREVSVPRPKSPSIVSVRVFRLRTIRTRGDAHRPRSSGPHGVRLQYVVELFCLATGREPPFGMAKDRRA